MQLWHILQIYRSGSRQRIVCNSQCKIYLLWTKFTVINVIHLPMHTYKQSCRRNTFVSMTRHKITGSCRNKLAVNCTTSITSHVKQSLKIQLHNVEGYIIYIALPSCRTGQMTTVSQISHTVQIQFTDIINCIICLCAAHATVNISRHELAKNLTEDNSISQRKIHNFRPFHDTD